MGQTYFREDRRELNHMCYSTSFQGQGAGEGECIKESALLRLERALGRHKLQVFSQCLITAKILGNNTETPLLDTTHHIDPAELNAQI